jgi:hypothetical protein
MNGMDETTDQARHRDEENRAEFATRKEEKSLEVEQHRLEHELQDFDHAEAEAKSQIEAEWRTEHQGHDPVRPPAWRDEQRSPADDQSADTPSSSAAVGSDG